MTVQRRLRFALIPLGLAFLGSGCPLEKGGIRAPMAPEKEQLFREECAQLRQIGDVVKLGHRVDEDIRQMMRVSRVAVDVSGTSSDEATVHGLVADITSSVADIKALTAPQWSTQKWQTTQTWEFGPSDLALLDPGCDLDEKAFLGFEVTQVIWDGVPHPELVPTIRSESDHHSARFVLDLSQSTLSLCELLSTTGIQVRVTFETCGQSDYRYYALSLGNPAAGE